MELKRDIYIKPLEKWENKNMTILKEGMTVFYIEDSNVFSGQVIDVEQTPGGGYEFSIDSYGACEGHYRISSSQVDKTVFLSEEQAKAMC